jgi:hypothetical protein
MGFSQHLFQDEVDEELICSICMDVYDEPVQDEDDHTFCKSCIHKWLETSHHCPLDRKLLHQWDLKKTSRLVTNLLTKLHIKCEFESCGTVVTLDTYKRHLSECQYDPSKSVVCQKGCGLPIKLPLVEQHNCIEELKRQLASKASVETDFEAYKQKTKTDLCKTNARCQSLQNINENFVKQTKLLEEQIKRLEKQSHKATATAVASASTLSSNANIRRATSTSTLSQAAPRKKSRWNPSTLLIEN